MDWVNQPRVTDVTSSHYSVGSSSDATSPVCGDNSDFCANAINLTELYVPETVPRCDKIA